MTAPSNEQRELDLVDKVDFRILNVANNEAKLQDLLGRFLVPLLLKGASEHASVRAKVATVAQRLKLFIQPPGIVLPVAALLQQFKTIDSPVVRHLDVVFIQHSIGRMPARERRDLIPAILRGIGHVNSSTPALFDILLQSLSVLKLPPRGSKEDDAFREEIGLADPVDEAYVAERFGKLFLLSRAGALASNSDVTFFSYDQDTAWLRSGQNLAETRIRVANFLASGAFSDASRFMPALYAAAHSDSRVSAIGEDLLKRNKASLEDKDLVEQLFQAHAVLPPGYRIRILNLLSKSALSTSYTNEILAVARRNMDLSPREADAVSGSASTVPTARSRGLEMAKLYRALFEYMNWIARLGPGKADFSIGQALINFLQIYITKLGWPVPSYTGTDFETLRAKAYETMGALAKGARMTVPERLSLANWFFRALTEDPTAEVVVNIDGALSSMTAMFSPASTAEIRTEVEPPLRSLLLKYMQLSDDEPTIRRSARHAVAKWANNCLSFSDPIARWIDVVAAAGRRGERSDVVEEGHRGLDPWTYYSNSGSGSSNTDRLVLPQWQALVRTFFLRPISRLDEDDLAAPPADMEVDTLSPFVNFPGDTLDAYPLAVRYCQRMLLLTALPDFKIEPGWEQQVETLLRSDKTTRDTIRAYLKNLATATENGGSGEGTGGLSDLLAVSFAGMLQERQAIAEPCGRCFVELASLSPASVLAPLASRATELLALVKSNKKEIRKLGAAAIGLLGAHPANASGGNSVPELKAALVEATKPWKTAVGSELNATEGAFVALAHLISRRLFYKAADAQALAADVAAVLPTTEEITRASASFQDAIFDALAQLWTAGVKCLPGTASATADDKTEVSAVVDVLNVHAKKGNERAIVALGRLAIAFGSDSPSVAADDDAKDSTALILAKLYSLYELKQVEVHFAIGGAITAAVACWDSDIVELTLDVEEGVGGSDASTFRIPKRTGQLAATLEKILVDSKTTKPALLKASGIWLFSLIQHCSHLAEVQSRLRECQVAFMRLLSARDELVQETASRGLALVYEKGDEPLKGDLVRDLVASFTGTGTQLKVDEDTELFDAGALPTGEGKSVTSYKDIVSLANEVGDQSLIYKFMSLAANAATWSTRSAFGRFGLSNILSESEVDPKLYPKLYRYRFDPNPNVQRSMNDIWKALVKDSGAVIDAHFDAIVKDLLKSILGKEWRVREASCAALADLLQGRAFVQYEPYYETIWMNALKVLDDVKGSVREAALRLCIVLSNTLVRQLEEGGSGGSGGNSASAKAMMNEALPFLMSDKGIESGVEDVKVFATITVLKIAKHGGKALRPYIAAMVPHLLGLLSTIEPQALNYYYMRSGEEDKGKLDKMRSAMVSQSPISEAIENCLRNVDASVMTDLAPGLEAAMKGAVGMPTKIGCGRVLVTLATRHAADFGPYAGRFLQLLERQALDRNDEVSQSYARAAAYVMRAAPDAARTRFAGRFVDLYFSSEDEARRQKVADVVLALAKVSPDHFQALEGQLLPLAYLASHEADEYVHKACDEVWSKHAGSNLSVARYVPEIAALVQRALDTAQWALKHAGALTAGDAVAAVLAAGDLAGGGGQAYVGQLRTLWPLFQKAVALKTFDGKERLLDVLPTIVGKGRALWEGDAAIRAALRKMATVEAKRNNDAYRVHAFRCLWRMATEAATAEGDAGGASDVLVPWDDVVTIVSPHLEALRDWDDEMRDGDGAEKSAASASKGKDTAAASKERLVRQTAENALEAVARSYSRAALAADPAAVLAAVWKALQPYLTSDAFGLVRRSTWYKAATDLLSAALSAAKAKTADAAGAEATSAVAGQQLALAYLDSLDASHSEVGTEEQRSTRAKGAKALVLAVKADVFPGAAIGAGPRIKEVLQAALASERSLDVQKLLKEALAEA